MVARVNNINVEILRQCREQIGLAFADVEKKIKNIAAIEDELQKPTFNQLNTLSELYKVPRWVFVSETLPKQYQFNRFPRLKPGFLPLQTCGLTCIRYAAWLAANIRMSSFNHG